MTEQEKINADVQRQLALQDAKFNVFMEEMRDFKTEMRDRDNQRAKEIIELRQDMKDMQNRLDAKIDGMGKHVQNLTVAAIVGIGAAVAGIGAIAVTVIYSVLTR